MKDALMKTTFKAALLAAVAGLSVASSCFAQDIQSSVVTVGELLKIDNAQALQRAQDEASKTGVLGGKAGAAKAEVPLPVWSVRSVYGFGPEKHVDLRIDSQLIQRASVGQDVAMCHIDEIQDACVKLSAKTKKTRAGSCPARVCWTGNEIAAEWRASQSQGAANSFRLTPTPTPAAPLPLPQSNGALAGQPNNAAAR